MGGLVPGTGVSERVALTHRTDTRPDCVWWGNVCLGQLTYDIYSIFRISNHIKLWNTVSSKCDTFK
jgi:hypothetical protein